MKKIKILGSIVFIILINIFFQNNVEAKSYSVEDMKIEATINQDGSVGIEQELTYKFNGSYNGIYITVPFEYEDKEFKEIVTNNRIDDNLYNGKSVTVQSVSEISREEIVYKEINESQATNGIKGYFSNTQESDLQKIKVYSPSQDTTKTFKINYTINDLCVKHNDIGELYYNFIGGAWEVEIKNLEIDVFLPMNTEEVNIWGHGPYNGQSKIVSNSHINFKVENIKPGQYVAARILFDNYNIPNATKFSNIDAKEIIFEDENKIIENKEEKEAFTTKIIIFAICLSIYWIILILMFEKDKKYMVSNIDEEKLFEKYNPMIAGCIQGSRTILARDIIAVILNLIDKKIIKLEILNSNKRDENYTYVISKNIEKENEMDEIEKYIYDWVFAVGGTANLNQRLKGIPKERDANIKFKHINELVEKKLAEKGANQVKVPLIVRGFNIFLFILSCLVIIKHNIFNGFEIYNEMTSFNIIKIILIFSIACLPLIMGLLYIPLNLIVIIRHKINKTIQKISGQKVVSTTISLIILFVVIILITVLFDFPKYIIADEVLICIATILILTDNLMLKNNVMMIEDFSKLNTLKYKIQNYSIMEDRDIEQITLWEKYLSYAVSFGCADKIIKRMKEINIDDDILGLIHQKEFKNIVDSDYYYFYKYASPDKRFLKAYKETNKKIGSAYASSSGGYSSGSGGGFSGGGGYSGGGGRGGGRRCFLI